MNRPGPWVTAAAVVCLSCFSDSCLAQQVGASVRFDEINRYIQQRSVKIYGTGGMRQLEAYQSGILISNEGHVATVSSVVLDRDEATVILGDGRRYIASVVGVDPLTDIAVLKLASDENEFPAIDLAAASTYTHDAYPGMRVLAFSNLYNVATGQEPVSVQHGVLTTVAPLEARRGAFASNFRDDVYIVDAATNNPGAAGGLLTDAAGHPLGMLGKELRSELTGGWLNFALPLPIVDASVERILSGSAAAARVTEAATPKHPATLATLGLYLVPSVVPRTPPYVDHVTPDSAAANAGIEPDDLVVAVASVITGTTADVDRTLSRTDMNSAIAITLLRGNKLIDVELPPTEPASEKDQP